MKNSKAAVSMKKTVQKPPKPKQVFILPIWTTGSLFKNSDTSQLVVEIQNFSTSAATVTVQAFNRDFQIGRQIVSQTVTIPRGGKARILGILEDLKFYEVQILQRRVGLVVNVFGTSGFNGDPEEGNTVLHNDLVPIDIVIPFVGSVSRQRLMVLAKKKLQSLNRKKLMIIGKKSRLKGRKQKKMSTSDRK